MKIALVTDAWEPQVNGVVVTLRELVRELEQLGRQVAVFHPGQFHTRFPEILQAALGVPLSWGYALFRHFHRPSSGVMVPTQGMMELLSARGFRQLRPWTHGVDTGLFAFAPEPLPDALTEGLMRPIALFVGRVSHEKNIEAFLQLDTPGSKIACGVGPLEEALRQRHPQVRWLGVLPRAELARLYASANVFVFPSRSGTFGRVMLEAMASGTPVAAYPAEGPNEVVAHNQGGCLHEDLHRAFYGALAVPRSAARARALEFGWAQSAGLFATHLVPVRSPGPVHGFVTPASQYR